MMINTLLTDITELTKTPLFQLNPNRFDDDIVLLSYILDRYKSPWNETVSLQLTKDIVTNTFELEDNDGLISLILSNPVKEIKCSDLFIGSDPNVTLLKVMTIKNGIELKEHINANLYYKELLFVKELANFSNQKEPNLFVANGIIYVDEGYSSKNLTLWDGSKLRLIKHKEHDFYVPPTEMEYGDKIFIGGDYDFSTLVARLIDNINWYNKNAYKDRINHDWVVGQPLYILRDVYGFIFEVIKDTSSQIENLIKEIKQ